MSPRSRKIIISEAAAKEPSQLLQMSKILQKMGHLSKQREFAAFCCIDPVQIIANLLIHDPGAETANLIALHQNPVIFLCQSLRPLFLFSSFNMYALSELVICPSVICLGQQLLSVVLSSNDYMFCRLGITIHSL